MSIKRLAYFLVVLVVICLPSIAAARCLGAGLIVLDPHGNPGLELGGSATNLIVNNGAIQVNSLGDGPMHASVRNPAGDTITAEEIDICGPEDTYIGDIPDEPPVFFNVPYMPDPLRNLAPPSWSDTNDLSPIDVNYGKRLPISSGTWGPGYYSAGINISGSGTTNLNPGIYILGGAGLQVSSISHTFTARGVMFYILKDSAKTKVNITGGPNLIITELKDGSVYDGMAIFQAGANPNEANPTKANTNEAKITGGAGMELTGTLYFPKNNVTLNGTSTSFGIQIIAWTLTIGGGGSSTELIINYDGRNNLPYSGGDGTTENPYQIANACDFQQLSATPTDWNKPFVLTADVNLAGVTLTPVGNNVTQFTGVFDGNGHIIHNAVIYQPNSNGIGLFGNVLGGQIRNLGVEGVNMTGYVNVGGLVGYNNFGLLTSCYVTGTVSGMGNYVGGLVGYNYYGTLTSCYANSSVSGISPDGYVGGLVGENDGTLTSCYATGSVTRGSYVGGLVGLNTSNISNCYSTSTVNSNYSDSVGGLVGYNNEGTITSCYATGSVTGTGESYFVGGLVGTNSGTLTDCNATGAVTGTDHLVGGLVGVNSGTLTDCYAAGSVSGFVGVGGLVGDNSGMLTDCYAASSVSGHLGYSGGLVGNNSGTLIDCYATGSVSDGGGLVGYNDSGTLIGCYATGSVIGGGGLVGENYVGTLTYCYATGAVIGGGGLVGKNSFGTITSCYATGSVIGESSYVGGLVGENSWGTLTYCYATGSVSGNSFVGGLVGMNSGTLTLTDCYATGSVSGNSVVGGLVGCGGPGTNCFWDMETSGQSVGVGCDTSTGVTGKSTAEMMTLSKFTSAVCDFVGEVINGPNDIWDICDGTNYPKLSWQIPLAGDFVCPDGVDFIDFAILANAWLSDPTQVNWNGRCDIAEPQNSVIDILDLALFTQHWLEGL